MTLLLMTSEWQSGFKKQILYKWRITESGIIAVSKNKKIVFFTRRG
jgi:hypothetical protein